MLSNDFEWNRKICDQSVNATTPSKRPPNRRHPLRPTSFQMFYVGSHALCIDRIIGERPICVLGDQWNSISDYWSICCAYSNGSSYAVKHTRMCRSHICCLMVLYCWFTTVAAMRWLFQFNCSNFIAFYLTIKLDITFLWVSCSAFSS